MINMKEKKERTQSKQFEIKIQLIQTENVGNKAKKQLYSFSF